MNLNGVDSVPMKQILPNSLYYPSCGRDGDPVKYLAGFVHSFVYVDYGLTHDEVWDSLHDAQRGFAGYDLLWCRDVAKYELIPAEASWSISPNPSVDGDPSVCQRFIKPPFAIWSVYERKRDYGDSHGPERFSLLYVGGEGVATFEALYYGNSCAPDVVAIIQPGTGFGGNWTDFRNPKLIFGRVVLQNPNGRPKYLLYGGWGYAEDVLAFYYKGCCWPTYSNPIHRWRAANGALGLWCADGSFENDKTI